MKRILGRRLWSTVLTFFAQALLLSAGYGADKTVIREPVLFPAEHRVRSVLDCMQTGIKLFGDGDMRRAAIEFEKVLLLDPGNKAAEEYLQQCQEVLSTARGVRPRGNIFSEVDR